MTLPATNHRATAVCYVGASSSRQQDRRKERTRRVETDELVLSIYFRVGFKIKIRPAFFKNVVGSFGDRVWGCVLRVRGLPSPANS